jgi:hypothetical protein
MSGNVAFADTSLLTTADGWTKITSISQTDIANNYYVFVDNDADLMLGLAASTNQSTNAMFYQASTADLTKDLAKVWILEANGSNYAMRNLNLTALQLQTEWSGSSNDLKWRTNDQDASISWTGLGLSYEDGAWTMTSTQYSRPLGIYNNTEGSPAEGNELGANDAGKGQKFQIYSIPQSVFKAKLLEGASADNPIDATALIYNASLDYKNNNNRIGCWSGTSKASSGNLVCNNSAAEMWHVPNFDLNQTVSDLTNGKYQLSVQLAQELGTYSAEFYVVAGDATKTAMANTPIDGDFAAVAKAMAADRSKGKLTLEAIVTNNELTIGLRDANSSSDWIVFDNFTMTYLGPLDISDYVTNYTTALDAAKAVNQESPMNADVLAALQTALSSYGNADQTSQDALVEATNALSTATTNANASIEAYASAKAAMDNVLKFIESTNFYTTDALNTYKTNDYTTPMAKYEARTLTDAEAKAVQDPYANGGWNKTRNVWALLRSTWADASFNINTWSTEGDTDGSEFVLPFVEWWVADKNTLPEGTKSGTLGGLNAGKVYEVTANTRVRMSNNQTEVKGVTMDVNGGSSINLCDGSQVGSSQFYLKGESKVYGLVGDDGNLTINLNASSSNTISWLAFKDVNYKETDIAVLNEDGTNTIIAAEDIKIGVKRSFKSYVWNSVVLPFDLSYSQVQAIFGNGTKTAEYTGATSDDDANTVTLNFTTAEGNNVAIKANTPCLVRPTKTMTFAVAEGVDVVAPTAALTVDDALVSFEGSYNNDELKVTDQDFFLSDDNKLYRAQGGETVKGFRAIFRLKSSSAFDAKFNVAFDDYGETTAIAAPAAVSHQAVNVYNLAGQLVKKNAISLNGLQKGLYVVNGKKVVVK